MLNLLKLVRVTGETNSGGIHEKADFDAHSSEQSDSLGGSGKKMYGQCSRGECKGGKCVFS